MAGVTELRDANQNGPFRRLSRREVEAALALSRSRVLELFREGYFLSARQSGGRHAWTVAACCIEAELDTEWPCGVCLARRRGRDAG
jgi:hypothetical protein